MITKKTVTLQDKLINAKTLSMIGPLQVLISADCSFHVQLYIRDQFCS